jgi:hypothetical protein
MKTMGDIMDDGTVHPELQTPGLTQSQGSGGGAAKHRHSPRRSRSRSEKRGKRGNRREDKKNLYTHSEGGCPICPDYNAGKCKEVKSGTAKTKGKGKGEKKAEGANCPKGKAHICFKCRGKHSSKNCTIKDY